MLIKCFTVGQLQTNCYIVTDERSLKCAVIDPGAESGTILNYLDDNRLNAECIFLTHGHFDHTKAVPAVYAETKARVYINRGDANLEDFHDSYRYHGGEELGFYSEGDVIEVGALKFTVMETPGHSRGSVTLRCENALFTGDTLFRDSCGRTDLEGGSMEVLNKSLRRLYELEGDFEVYPGHMDSTTLERERKFNYYMLDAMEK